MNQKAKALNLQSRLNETASKALFANNFTKAAKYFGIWREIDEKYFNGMRAEHLQNATNISRFRDSAVGIDPEGYCHRQLGNIEAAQCSAYFVEKAYKNRPGAYTTVGDMFASVGLIEKAKECYTKKLEEFGPYTGLPHRIAKEKLTQLS